jgi:HPt (histidine-containing phosphotransfer) domain-containing protein
MPILDTSMLESLRELASPDQPDFLRNLLTLFTQSAPGRIRTLLAALQSGDLSHVGREAHTLKSSAANIGATEFSEICQAIEKAARSNDSQMVQSQAPLLQPALDAVFRELSQLPEMK